MIKSIFYKEWIKSRWLILVMSLVFAGFIIYMFMTVSRGLRVAGAIHIWEVIVMKGVTFVTPLKFVSLACGVLLALTQFLPEMVNKRLKLTLHLPLSESKIILTMLGYGAITMIIINFLAYGIVFIGMNKLFTTEITQMNLSVMLPWLLAGIAGYLITSWICFEPVWKQRIFDFIIGALMLSLFFFEVKPGGYTPLIPWLVLLIVISVSFSFYSAIRFKDGEQ